MAKKKSKQQKLLENKQRARFNKLNKKKLLALLKGKEETKSIPDCPPRSFRKLTYRTYKEEDYSSRTGSYKKGGKQRYPDVRKIK